MGSLWLILLQNSHSLLYGIIVAYSPFQQPFIVICEVVAYSPFQQPFIVIQDNCGFSTATLLYANIVAYSFSVISTAIICGLFSFSTAIHCYIGIVAYSPFQQPLIVIQDHCGLFSFSTAIHCYIVVYRIIIPFQLGSLWSFNCYMRTLFSFSEQPAIHCYMRDSHSLWLILLFNSHSLLYANHCGLFSFSTAIHCYIGHCGLFSFTILLFNSHSLLIPLFYSSHSLLYGIIGSLLA